MADVLRAEFPPSEVAFGVVAFPVGKEEQPAQAEFAIVKKLMPAGEVRRAGAGEGDDRLAPPPG